MATKEQIDMLIVELDKAKPANFVKRMDETTAGISAVLRFLSEHDDIVTAGRISRFMHVSTARVAVLLKKMEAKGLIIKEPGVTDARTTVVKLSDLGWKTVEKMSEDMYNDLGTLIDKVGMERMLEFADILSEIQAVMKCPSLKV